MRSLVRNGDDLNLPEEHPTDRQARNFPHHRPTRTRARAEQSLRRRRGAVHREHEILFTKRHAFYLDIAALKLIPSQRNDASWSAGEPARLVILKPSTQLLTQQGFWARRVHAREPHEAWRTHE